MDSSRHSKGIWKTENYLALNRGRPASQETKKKLTWGKRNMLQGIGKYEPMSHRASGSNSSVVGKVAE